MINRGIFGQKYDIWRTYYNKKSNISEGARLIEKYLYQRRGHHISKRTKKDADLLTDFFRELKIISMEEMKKNPLQKTISANILGAYLKDLPLLNFFLGGNAKAMLVEKGSSGGIEFEKEIEKLIKFDEQDKITGTATGAAYINLGVKDEASALELVKKIFNDETLNEVKNIESKIIKRVNENNVPYFYLKVGVSRAGKIDVGGSGKAETNFTIDGQPNQQISKVKELLEDSSFSIKSYLTGGSIELGGTDPQKAVSAVAEYVASKTKNKDHIRSAGIYYIRHPEPGKDKYISNQQQERVEELYARYGRIKKVYELVGMGLKYNDIDELRNVDFLLVNRAFEGGDINVYSTQDLVYRFGLNEYYKFDIK